VTLKYSTYRAIEIINRLPGAITGTEILHSSDKPDYSPPCGVHVGSPEHILFITFTVAIDTEIDSLTLWNSVRKAYEGEKTRYLFSPASLYEIEADQIQYDLKKLGLCKKGKKVAEIWKNMGIFLFQKWGGDPRNFLSSCNWDGNEILNRMIPSRYNEVYDFHHFFGEKKGQLWLTLLRKQGEIHQITNLYKTPLITDIHTVRASIALGLIYGSYSGQISIISQKVRELWENAIHITIGDNLGITPYELAESLRNLSKNGCSQKDGKRISCPQFENCPFNKFCVQGIFSLENKGVLIDTIKEGLNESTKK
jgi:hypothetical protein